MFSFHPLAIIVGIAVSLIPSSATGQNACMGIMNPYLALSCRIGIVELSPSQPDVAQEPSPSVVHAIPGVRVTTYRATLKETDADPKHTASGVLVSPGMIAVSPDLLWRHGGPFHWGDTLTLSTPGNRTECNRSYVVQDVMAPRWTKRVDIFLPMNVNVFSCYDATITYEADDEG